mgnify:CR=1 FL=1
MGNGELASCSAQELLERFRQNGSEAPFEEVVRRYAGMVFHVCMQVTRNRHDAEDATQAVFLSLAVQSKTGRPIKALGPWLQQVAYRMSLDIRKSHKRRQVREDRHGEIARANGNGIIADSSITAGQDELKALLLEELNRLPSKYRLPLILHYFGGLTREEMSRELNCKPSTLGVRLFRGRELLANRLAERGATLAGGALALLLMEVVRTSVTDSLLAATCQAASRMVNGYNPGAGLISARVMTLVRGAGRAVVLARCKALAVTVLAAGSALAAGAQVIARVRTHDWKLEVPPIIKPDLRLPPILERIHAAAGQESVPHEEAAAPDPSAAPLLASDDSRHQGVVTVGGLGGPPPPGPLAHPSSFDLSPSRLPPPGPALAFRFEPYAPSAPAASARLELLPPAAGTSAATFTPSQSGSTPLAFGAARRPERSQRSAVAVAPTEQPLEGGVSRRPHQPRLQPPPVAVVDLVLHPLDPDSQRSGGLGTGTFTAAPPPSVSGGAAVALSIPLDEGSFSAMGILSQTAQVASAELPEPSGFLPLSQPLVPTYQSDGRVLIGYGKVAVTGTLDNSGRVVADGGGVDRTLDFTSAQVVRNSIDNSPFGGVNGWFATNRGRIDLPAAEVQPGDTKVVWGENPSDPVLDLINSLRLDFAPAGRPATVKISLLSPDRTDVPPLRSQHILLGIWSIDAKDLDLRDADVTIRYDDQMAWALGAQEAALRLWRYDGQWHAVPDGLYRIDESRNLIIGMMQPASFLAVSTAEVSISQYKSMSTPVTPEPSTLLLGAAAAIFLSRRPRRGR